MGRGTAGARYTNGLAAVGRRGARLMSLLPSPRNEAGTRSVRRRFRPARERLAMALGDHPPPESRQNFRAKMRLGGFEPPTGGLEGRCSSTELQAPGSSVAPG